MRTHIAVWADDESPKQSGESQALLGVHNTGEIDRANEAIASMTSDPSVPLEVNPSPTPMQRPDRRSELMNTKRLNLNELISAYPDDMLVGKASEDLDLRLATEIVYTHLDAKEWGTPRAERMIASLMKEIVQK